MNTDLKCASRGSGPSSGKGRCCVHNTCSPRVRDHSTAASSGHRKNDHNSNNGHQRLRFPEQNQLLLKRTGRKSHILWARQLNFLRDRTVQTACCFHVSLFHEAASALEFEGNSGFWKQSHLHQKHMQKKLSREDRYQFVLEWLDRDG